MEAPHVSVCIPTYNGAEFLEECLDSVSSQSYRDLEIIIVDDDSKDATVEISERHARADPRVQVLRNPRNLGLVGNWNRCVGLAKGEWVKFLFQDDLLAPSCIERLVEHGQESGLPMVACQRNFIFGESVDDETRRIYELHRTLVEEWIPDPVLTPEALADLALRFMPRNFIGEPTVVMLSAALMRSLGPFNADLIQLCDAEYWLRAGLVEGIGMVREPLASFRVHASSTTSRNKALRDFRMRVMDPLIIRHEYLFSPDYASLRAHARAKGLSARLSDAYWEMFHYGHDEAEMLAAGGDPNVRREWQTMCSRYSHMTRVPMVHHLRRKTRRVFELAAQIGRALE